MNTNCCSKTWMRFHGPPQSSVLVLSPISKARAKHSAHIAHERRPTSEGCCGWALRRAIFEAATLIKNCFCVCVCVADGVAFGGLPE